MDGNQTGEGARGPTGRNVGDLIQLDGSNPKFAWCFAIVRDVYSWGVYCDVVGPHTEQSVTYPFRAEFDHFYGIADEVYGEP